MNRINNPYAALNQYYSQADMIATRSSFPADSAEIYGAAVCIGFIYIKYSFISLGLLDGLSSHMQNIHRPDDQRSMNNSRVSIPLTYPTP